MMTLEYLVSLCATLCSLCVCGEPQANNQSLQRHREQRPHRENQKLVVPPATALARKVVCHRAGSIDLNRCVDTENDRNLFRCS